ncbi:ABC-2 transporter permease [Methanolapillus ohkumae]|uniref:ABC-2 transporter permease n=1 Tax=Methanolapillus ohkumae TaxID=3028298 RepID=A0AA96V4Z0_9EURY|nr:hypothetical protein MsAm2_04540 [Methanosarcinaceae archaeon Am2]
MSQIEMKRIGAFARLDFYTIKPYLKSFYLMIVILVLFFLFLRSVSILAAMAMVSLVTISSYPFTIGEKNNMDILYSTLSLKRKDVVIGRYVFMLFIEIAGMSLIFLLSLVMQYFFKTTYEMMEVFITLCILLAISLSVAAIQYPIYFKIGYTKAKFMAMLPLFMIFGLIIISPFFIQNMETVIEMADSNIMLIGGIAVLLGFVFLAISCWVSCKLYQKRDL